ncbi:MAG: CPBP family glutamic-type intramembrane protease [Patescibacteria group bacterium]
MKYILFVSFLLLLGIMGRFLDDQNPQGPIGKLLWILIPSIYSIFRIKKEKIDIGFFRPNTKNWFLFLSIIDIAIINVIIISFFKPIFGGSWSFEWSTLLQGFFSLFVFSMMEEFIWRGFLQSKLEQKSQDWIKNGILTGFAWFCWQLMYITPTTTTYLPQIDTSSYNLYLNSFLSMILLSLILSFFRKYNKSIWTPIVFHTLYNCITLLIINSTNIEFDLLASPAVFSTSFVIACLLELIFINQWIPKLIPEID